MTKKSTLVIIIVNWNSGNHLRECISSIESTLSDQFILSKIIVVDNNSTDMSLEAIKKFNTSICVIKNKENIGFAAACNKGASNVSCDYLLFLNPDTRLYKNSLSAPIDFMQRSKNADVGVVGVQLVDENNKISLSCARFPSVCMFVAGSLGLNRLPLLKHFNMHMFDWAHDKSTAVDHVIGAFYLIRHSLFNLVSGFDERFFVYLEDLDLSLRIKQAGWKIFYIVEAQAFHAGGGTSRQVKSKRLFYSLRSCILYVYKHYNLFSAMIVIITILFVELISRSFFAIINSSLESLKETWAAYIMLYKWLPKWIFKGITN